LIHRVDCGQSVEAKRHQRRAVHPAAGARFGDHLHHLPICRAPHRGDDAAERQCADARAARRREQGGIGYIDDGQHAVGLLRIGCRRHGEAARPQQRHRRRQHDCQRNAPGCAHKRPTIIAGGLHAFSIIVRKMPHNSHHIEYNKWRLVVLNCTILPEMRQIVRNAASLAVRRRPAQGTIESRRSTRWSNRT
jgi:hypothetical protein